MTIKFADSFRETGTRGWPFDCIAGCFMPGVVSSDSRLSVGYTKVSRSNRTSRSRVSRRQIAAPRAVSFKLYKLLNAEDLRKATSSDAADPMPPKDLHELAEHLNEVLSDYLQGAEPGTRDREGALLRYRWFTDVAATADHLQQLLQPVDHSALLLSSVGQRLLWLESLSTKQMTLAAWQDAVSNAVEWTRVLKRRAQAGQHTIERELFEVETDVSGWPTVLNTRRMGRPPDCDWASLAEQLMVAWRYMTGRQATVTVDPTTDPPTRRSAAATFAAGLLDSAAERLPPDKSWAGDRLRGQEAKLVEYLEAKQRRRRPSSYKRRKSAAK